VEAKPQKAPDPVKTEPKPVKAQPAPPKAQLTPQKPQPAPQIEESAPPVAAAPAPAPKPAAQSVDKQYEERTAKECDAGFTGILCREKVRLNMCKGLWSENPPAGQSICKGAPTSNSN
jgi:hypothetical protein